MLRVQRKAKVPPEAPPQVKVILPDASPPVANLLQKMEALEKDLDTLGQTGHTRWMVPYADLLTLLLGLFLVLFTASSKPEAMKNLSLQNQSANTLKHSESQPTLLSQQSQDKAKDSALAKQLQQQIHQGLQMKDVVIRQQERGLVISLKDSILFAPGSAELSGAAKKTLDRLSGKLAIVLHGQSRPIRVEGHTDNTPITTSRYPSNWELSTARATNIVRYLIASHHFSPANLSAAGYGEFRPVENNSSIEGKQKNRRVDIVILNDSTAHQEPPQLSRTTPTMATGSVRARTTGED